MSRRSPAILAICALLIATLTFTGPGHSAVAAPNGGPEYVPDQVIVGFTADASDADRDDALAGAQAVSERTLDGIAASVARVPAGTVANAIATLKRHAKVRYAEPNYIVHAIGPTTGPLALSATDPRFNELWGLKNTGQVIGGVAGKPGADISAETAWTTTTGSRSVIVGVVDTGVDYTHPDLAANVWSNPGGVAGCPLGTRGYNAITRSCDPMDDHYHGTHVSGTIGAVGNNGIGVVGVNWAVSIMGLKFLNANGSGTTADAIGAIDFAVQAKIAGQNVRVLSNSWGGGGFSQALLDEINKANTNNILFVAAAGNSSANNDRTPHYPSSYNTTNMVSVAATDNLDALASFSNYGATSVHLGAPGVNTLSTMPASSYDYLSGTSMATPHVSGVAALVLAVPAFSAFTVAQLKSQILNNVDPIPSLTGLTVTGGRLNAAKAVGPAGPPPAPDFTMSVSPSSVSVAPGATATYTVTITPSGGFTGAVTLSTSALPTGAAASFSPNPATTSSTLTMTTSASTPTGSYPFTITGVSGTLTHTASATLVVATAPVADFSLSASPTSRTISVGRKTTYTISITPSGGFTGAVTFGVSGLPSGATASFNPNPTGTSSKLTVWTSSTTPVSTSTLLITGVSGSLSHSITVTLLVQ